MTDEYQELIAEIESILTELYGREDTRKWLTTAQEQFGGEKPIDLIARGEAQKVRTSLETLVSRSLGPGRASLVGSSHRASPFATRTSAGCSRRCSPICGACY